MTATTTAREARRKDAEMISYPMAAVKIPKGVLVNINSSGYATNATDTAGETFAGVAYESVDNSYGSAGALSIRVQPTGSFEFIDGGANCAQTDVGITFKIVDNQTVTDACTINNIVAGVCVDSVSPTIVRIRINRYAS